MHLDPSCSSSNWNLPGSTLGLSRHVSGSWWRIHSWLRYCGRRSCRSLDRRILRWRGLRCRFDPQCRRLPPRATRASLRTIHPSVAHDFLNLSNFYSTFEAVDCHLFSGSAGRSSPSRSCLPRDLTSFRISGLAPHNGTQQFFSAVRSVVYSWQH